MSSYLTTSEAAVRLTALGLTSQPTAAMLDLASRRLDCAGPYFGARTDPDQDLAFPRTYTASGDTEDVVPDAVKEWVALEAHKLTQTTTAGDKPPVSSISFSDAGSVTYARPKVDAATSLQRGLLKPYQMTYGKMD